jgi:hypothetical protein
VRPGGLDQQPAGVGVAGLRDRSLGTLPPEDDSVVTKPRYAPMVDR